MTDKRKEILDNSHLNSSSEFAREYFKDSEINFSDLKMKDFEKLRSLIQIEIDKISADDEYHMITELAVKAKIKKNKDGVFLRISGSYFSDREGISFNINDNNFIGFCYEMDGCNRIPFIAGFVKWVDFLKEIKLTLTLTKKQNENI